MLDTALGLRLRGCIFYAQKVGYRSLFDGAVVIEEAKKDLPKTGDPLYDAFFNLPEIDIPLTEDEARMQEKIRALCKEMEANK